MDARDIEKIVQGMPSPDVAVMLCLEAGLPVDGWRRSPSLGGLRYTWPDLPNPIDRPDDPNVWAEDRPFISIEKDIGGWSWSLRAGPASSLVAEGGALLGGLAAREAIVKMNELYPSSWWDALNLWIKRQAPQGSSKKS
jgi:hypothetical protein